YTINKDLWDRMNTNNRAGLILHEIIYKEALRDGQHDSVKARYFNAYLSSTKMASFTPQQYSAFLVRVGFPEKNCTEAGYVFSIDHPDSRAKTCFLSDTVETISDGDFRGLAITPQPASVRSCGTGGPSDWWYYTDRASFIGEVELVRRGTGVLAG